MKVSSRNAETVIIAVFLALTMLSCTNKFFVAVVQPTETKAIARNRIKVYIDLSAKSLLNNKIAIFNKSRETISVYPVDIVLCIERTGVMLPAVTDYREYVRMRYAEARKKCSDADHPRSCTDAIDRVFKRYLKAKPFVFGEIPPGTKRVGYFAFNLPDPFNTTGQAKRAAEVLRSKMNLLYGQIEVNAVLLSNQQDLEFVFPVNVITSSDENDVILGVLKNY
ncbi:MAG: hypothetical protein JXA18_14390 [Chitinispirillaceae bacterium]|nr:hypothetical protein [Chitinispirillaceae bacterium]